MWKTTDRYVQQKRVKAVEAESKLKQVYIPNYSKPNTAVLNNNKGGGVVGIGGVVGGNPGGGGVGGIIGGLGGMVGQNIVGGGILNGSSNGNNGNNDIIAMNSGKPCESCSSMSSQQWYAWGPPHLSCRLCHTCWHLWKKYGGIKTPSRLNETDIVDAFKKQQQQQQPQQQQHQQRPSNEVEEDRLNDMSNRQIQRFVSSAISHSQKPFADDQLFFFFCRCSIANCGKEFKLKAHLVRHYAQSHGMAMRSGSPRPIMKTRTAFYLNTSLSTRLSRKVCRHLIRPKKAARQPSFAINIQAVKQECKSS